MKEKWVVSAKRGDFNAIAEEFQIDPVLARIIRNRDVESKEDIRKFLYGQISDLPSPLKMKNVDEGVKLLERLIKEEKKIRIIGDYDVDGICATYILKHILNAMGARVDAAIPHRVKDGYGLNENLIQNALEDGIEAVITCDNGIAASDAVKLAKENGMIVIVTDHHEVPFVMDGEKKIQQLPCADIIIDPKQEGETYPFTGICGAVVAYKLMDALMEKTSFPFRDKLLTECMEFAALATVCDVMDLKDENRILVKEGMSRMRNSANYGLRALIEVNGLLEEHLSTYHLGFVIGPCMNATGRLDSATKSLELLEAESYDKALTLACELKEMNESRKNMTQKGVEKAGELVGEDPKDSVLIIYLPEVHESLAGIIAGRMKEKYYRPVFVLTDAEDGLKGSGRSIEAYHMYDEMNKVKELFTKFGGHKMAAGCSLEKKNLEILREEINKKCTLTEDDFYLKVLIDVPMPMEYASLKLAKQLQLLEPMGNGNPSPLFAQKNACFVGMQYLGKQKNYLKFKVRTERGTEEVLYFGDQNAFLSFLDSKFGGDAKELLFKQKGEYPISMVYQIAVNSFRGQESLQYIMKNYS